MSKESKNKSETKIKNKEKILVTGGAGYIGSHTIIELLTDARLKNDNCEIISVDNFSNSSPEVYQTIFSLTGKKILNYKINITNLQDLRKVFKENPGISTIIHFAALKSVEESVREPLLYYQNNIGGLLNVLNCTLEFGIKKIVFSSSAAVYGNALQMPVNEKTPFSPAASPYGETKQMGEQMLRDFSLAHPKLRIASLRYFNPAGAHLSGKLGELPIGVPNNLLPYLAGAAAGIYPQITVFGSNYPTRDGSPIRDYVHVSDIASAHVLALIYLESQKAKPYDVFNFGSGQGVSVLEMIQEFEKKNDLKIPWVKGPRRKGDIAISCSDSNKAKRVLGWKPRHSLADMVVSAWKWQEHLQSQKPLHNKKSSKKASKQAVNSH